MGDNYIEIELKLLIVEIFKKWWILAIYVVVFAAATYGIIKTQVEPIYSAEATLFIGKDSGIVASISISDLNFNNDLISDYRELIKSRTVTDEVSGKLGQPISREQLIKNLEIYTAEGTRFMYITYLDKSQERATQVANLFSDVLVDKAEEIVGVKNIRIVDYALVPDEPINGNLVINMVIAGVFGIIMGIITVFIIMFMHNTIKDEQDVENIMGLPVLGSIPKFKGEERI